MEFTSTTLDSCGPRRHHSVVLVALTFSRETSGTWEPLGSCEIWAEAEAAAAAEVVAAREIAPGVTVRTALCPALWRRLLGSATEEEEGEEGAEEEEDEEEDAEAEGEEEEEGLAKVNRGDRGRLREHGGARGTAAAATKDAMPRGRVRATRSPRRRSGRWRARGEHRSAL